MENLRVLKNYDEKFYVKLDRDLEEIKSKLNYVLTEQEKQKISQMTISEILDTMLDLQKEMRADLRQVIERWEE